MTICNYPSCEHICSFASWQRSYIQRDSQLLIQPGANEFPSAGLGTLPFFVTSSSPELLLLPTFPFLSCIFPQGQIWIQDRFSKVATGVRTEFASSSVIKSHFLCFESHVHPHPTSSLPVQEHPAAPQPLVNSRMVLQDGHSQEKEWNRIKYFPGRDLEPQLQDLNTTTAVRAGTWPLLLCNE